MQISGELLLMGGCTTFLFIVLGAFLASPILRFRNYLHFISSKTNRSHELLSREFETQEETFQKLSLELHDQVGHTLSLAKLQLTSLIDASEENEQKIKACILLIGRSLDELRQISKGLHTDYILCHGLIKAIDQELHYIKRSGNFVIDFEVTGISFFLDDKTEIFLFRIVQECLSNILRHAHANAISIHLNYTSSCFCMSISDNGSGFAAAQNHAGKSNSSGLSNIIKRGKLINASVQIQSVEHVGTTINVKIPMYDKSTV